MNNKFIRNQRISNNSLEKNNWIRFLLIISTFLMFSFLINNSSLQTKCLDENEKLNELKLRIEKIEEFLKNKTKNLFKINSRLEKIENNLNSFISLISFVKKLELESKTNSIKYSNITSEEVKSLISQALAIYDADKTGQTDFALESAGNQLLII